MRKTALVTGASAGIGSEFARELARDGFDLVLVARRRERLEQLAQALAGELGTKTLVLQEDLSDPAAPQRIYEAVQRDGIQVDMLVNNAGAGIAKTFRDAPWSEHAQLIQVQVTAAAQLTHLFLPAMLERGYGRIIQVASLAALVPGVARSTLYPAAKAFLVRFSESLAAELWGSGVYVCAVCPGFTLSEFHDVMGTRRALAKLPRFMWQDARSVARAGIDAVMRNETVYVSGQVNQVLAHAVRMLSPRLARTLMSQQGKRYRGAAPSGDHA